MPIIKPLLLLIAWFAGGALLALALALVFAPYFVSVIANIGRRPITHGAGRSAAH